MVGESYSYLALLYLNIQASNPMIPVVALAIVKRYNAGEVAGADARRDAFEDNHGREMGNALDMCVVCLRMYGEDVLKGQASSVNSD